MLHRVFAWALAAVVVLAWAAPADARPKHRHRRKHIRKNMPGGWKWPPNGEMKRQGRRCLEELTELGVEWKSARRRRRIATPITVPSMNFANLQLVPTYRKPPFVMDCHLALALVKLAPTMLAMGVTEFHFSTIHKWRRARTNGVTKKTLSRHALGVAVDVYKVATKDGALHIVKDDPGSLFLAMIAVRARLTPLFRLVLNPWNDPVSHYDHLHFEAKVDDPRPARVIAGEKAKRRRIARRKRKLRRSKRVAARKARARAKKRRAKTE